MRTDWRPSGNGLWSGSETEARITAQTAGYQAPKMELPPLRVQVRVQGAATRMSFERTCTRCGRDTRMAEPLCDRCRRTARAEKRAVN